jgi:hypothetical protein
MTISACYSWEMALNVGRDISFDNMWEWKGIRDKAGEVNSTRLPVDFSVGVTLVSKR